MVFRTFLIIFATCSQWNELYSDWGATLKIPQLIFRRESPSQGILCYQKHLIAEVSMSWKLSSKPRRKTYRKVVQINLHPSDRLCALQTWNGIQVWKDSPFERGLRLYHHGFKGRNMLKIPHDQRCQRHERYFTP